jgi:hypothetical protein
VVLDSVRTDEQPTTDLAIGILRAGNAPIDIGPQPDYVGEDLDAVADQLSKACA